MMKSVTLHLENIDMLNTLADLVAKDVKSGMLFLFKGEIGVGKTTFICRFASQLGITEGVSSPTFTLANHYQGDFPFYHLDLYRLDQVDALYSMDIQDYLSKVDGIVCIEWSEKLEMLRPEFFFEIALSYTENSDARLCQLSAKGEVYEPLLNAVYQKMAQNIVN